MSARNPLPKINQFNSPKCPHISKPWTRLRWNLSFMPKVAGEITKFKDVCSTWWPKADVRRGSNLLPENPVKNSLRNPLCPCQRRHPAASAGERARSPRVLVLARAQLHHFARPEHVLPAEGNTMNKTTFFCPHCFQLQLVFSKIRYCLMRKVHFFFASSCRFQFVNST